MHLGTIHLTVDCAKGGDERSTGRPFVLSSTCSSGLQSRGHLPTGTQWGAAMPSLKLSSHPLIIQKQKGILDTTPIHSRLLPKRDGKYLEKKKSYFVLS